MVTVSSDNNKAVKEKQSFGYCNSRLLFRSKANTVHTDTIINHETINFDLRKEHKFTSVFLKKNVLLSLPAADLICTYVKKKEKKRDVYTKHLKKRQ